MMNSTLKNILNKGKAVLYSLFIIILYYIVKPVEAVLYAIVESQLRSFEHFVEVIKREYEKDTPHPGDYWAYVKELWKGGDDG